MEFIKERLAKVEWNTVIVTVLVVAIAFHVAPRLMKGA
jgi:membrane-anchored glycerophosphoryl diester phosphodiesterase (GDPDase)